MKKTLLSCFLLLLMAVTANAQIVKGDMNDDKTVDITDVVSSVNVVLGNRPMEVISASDILDPYMVDNSKVIGTWYKTKTETVTFGEDGTTDYTGATRYEFMPYQGRLILYNSADTPIGALNILKATDDFLYIAVMGTSTVSIYTKTKPVYTVSSITLSETSIVLEPDATKRLTATILPADADDNSVSWSSSDESIATVINGLVVAISAGTATITCSANDGSGVKASCVVSVYNMIDGHAYVDLGLPSGTLWATTNVGADSPEEYGDYFAWGETTPQSDNAYSWESYKWCNGSFDTMTKYCTNSSYGDDGFTDGKAVLDANDDAARANWGGDWRMPTSAEFEELINNTENEWTTQNNVAGYKFTSKTNGNSIFLPAAGNRSDGNLDYTGWGGIYCSSSLIENAPYNAWYLGFYSGSVSTGTGFRYDGQSVRPVRKN